MVADKKNTASKAFREIILRYLFVIYNNSVSKLLFKVMQR